MMAIKDSTWSAKSKLLATPHTHYLLLALFVLFFFSGCSALIYQIMWQRMLFTAFGVDMESITIIVSVFMFGLGVGGLWGGILADRMSAHLLLLYIVIEIGIGLFGFLSPQIISILSNTAFIYNGFTTACLSFLILAFPTILMGATFPILVTHVNATYKMVGRSVGSLYFANTLGAALGAYFSGFVLLVIMDLWSAVYQAAILNLLIALTAFILFRRKQ